MPFKGGFVTNATLVQVTGAAPGTFRALVTGTGQVSHLGKASFEDRAAIIIDLETRMGTGTGTQIITAANGDQIFATSSIALKPRADGTSDVLVHFTITGGTGRFAGATGFFDGMDIANPQSSAGFLTITGQIAY